MPAPYANNSIGDSTQYIATLPGVHPWMQRRGCSAGAGARYMLPSGRRRERR